MPKSGAAMVSCGEVLCLFGGSVDGGHTDEMHLFNLKEGEGEFCRQSHK